MLVNTEALNNLHGIAVEIAAITQEQSGTKVFSNLGNTSQEYLDYMQSLRSRISKVTEHLESINKTLATM